MDLSFATFAAFFCLLGAARCAPTGPLCEDVRTSSLALNRIAKTVSEEARNGSLDEFPFEGLAWMEATDMCDPSSLKQKSAPCLGKILSVLSQYISIVESLSKVPLCSEFASRLEPEMHRLHKSINKCVAARTGVDHKDISTKETSGKWLEEGLCTYTFDRLFSFSILTARVFALGDPSGHADGSPQKCDA